ncbi:MAG: hypothetical protein H8E55_40195 [Pelagibacterales bacterium]|nr:hypothetical protein [Pelagibacterales bacterium]
MKRFISIIILILIFNIQFVTNAHAIGGLRQLFRGIVNTVKGRTDDIIRKGTDKWEKIFKSGESSPTIKKGAENTSSTSKGSNIEGFGQLAKEEKYSILEKIGKKNHLKNFFHHSRRVAKKERKFLKDIAEEGTEEMVENLTEEGFEKATDQGLEELAKKNDFYEYVQLHWIGRIYARSEYFSKPKVEKRILLVCKTENEIFYFSIIMEDKIKSASLIDHKYLSNIYQTKLFEQELFVLKDLDEFKIMSTKLEKGYNYPKHYFTIFKDQKFIYDKEITGTENPGIIINKAQQNSSISNNRCYKSTENELL